MIRNVFDWIYNYVCLERDFVDYLLNYISRKHLWFCPGVMAACACLGFHTNWYFFNLMKVILVCLIFKYSKLLAHKFCLYRMPKFISVFHAVSKRLLIWTSSSLKLIIISSTSFWQSSVVLSSRMHRTSRHSQYSANKMQSVHRCLYYCITLSIPTSFNPQVCGVPLSTVYQDSSSLIQLFNKELSIF